jgi:phospholipid/cholesterol/gamma-HCH transport system substrate-binding protein
MAITKRRYLDIILGLFIVVGIGLLGTFIFLIGKERRLFDDAAYINAFYPNVAGLNVGADVLLAGVVVGRVSEIKFPPLRTKTPNEHRQIKVVFRISSDTLLWIRQDSVARIDSKGLLGDKTINISLGSPDLPAIPDGGIINSVAPLDFNDALAKAQSVLENVTESIASARKLVEGFSAQGGDVALADAAIAIKNIVAEVQKGDGIIHKLVYDKKSGQDFHQLLAGLKDAANSIKGSTAHLNNLLAVTENGSGLLHSLIYDKKGEETVSLANSILADIRAVLQEVRSGSGIAHSLIYDSKKNNLITSLNEAAADLNSIIGSIKKGQGTVGRLLVDPSIYEDLKLVLGRVKRNEILKTLIRVSLPKGNRENIETPAALDQVP